MMAGPSPDHHRCLEGAPLLVIMFAVCAPRQGCSLPARLATCALPLACWPTLCLPPASPPSLFLSI